MKDDSRYSTSFKRITKGIRWQVVLHKVIDGRYCKGSTIITTNVDFKELGDYLGDPVITAATVDRMIHHSVIISIKGPSWRLYESKRLNTERSN
jgi:DNA replication protein DnaC